MLSRRPGVSGPSSGARAPSRSDNVFLISRRGLSCSSRSESGLSVCGGKTLPNPPRPRLHRGGTVSTVPKHWPRAGTRGTVQIEETGIPPSLRPRRRTAPGRTIRQGLCRRHTGPLADLSALCVQSPQPVSRRCRQPPSQRGTGSAGAAGEPETQTRSHRAGAHPAACAQSRPLSHMSVGARLPARPTLHPLRPAPHVWARGPEQTSAPPCPRPRWHGSQEAEGSRPVSVGAGGWPLHAPRVTQP